ncbi:MAG TPA: sigma-70 family RNA polymerase sigma factor [Chryseolinea sp.]|nr:sigma-70 family RNA polymerase sigma factor [Chryseolinea sp.]
MAGSIDAEFLKQINENMGIAHKISRVYFDDAATREDVIQEMLYQLWKSYKGFQKHSKFSTWMYSVCLNTALTFRRQVKKDVNLPLKEQHDEIPDTSTSAHDEDIKLLFQAIGKLSPLNKAIILLYLEDLSYDEIATITGLTKSNVSVRLVRAKKELEKYLNNKNH